MVDEKPPAKSGKPLGGVRAAAELLSGLDSAARVRILDEITQKDPKLALEIRKNLFTFEDLTRMSTWDIQKLLSKIPHDTLALALRNSPQEIKDFVLGHLSKRTGALLLEEMQNLGPRRLSEIEKAQDKIVALARELLKISE